MMTYTDWTNIRRCAVMRREAMDLYSDWADVHFSERYAELVAAEVAMLRLGVKAYPGGKAAYEACWPRWSGSAA
jgi:thiaminase